MRPYAHPQSWEGDDLKHKSQRGSARGIEKSIVISEFNEWWNSTECGGGRGYHYYCRSCNGPEEWPDRWLTADPAEIEWLRWWESAAP